MTRLIGILLAEQHDEWADAHRNASLESLHQARIRAIEPAEQPQEAAGLDATDWRGNNVADATSLKQRFTERDLSTRVGPALIACELPPSISVKGRIAAVAKDHLMLTTADGQDVFVPLSQIAFAVRHKG